MNESTALKLAVAKQLEGLAPKEQGHPVETSAYQPLTLAQMRADSAFTEKPPELVEGLIHQGTQVLFGGSSKSMKTFLTLQLALCVASGTPFLGRKTKKGKVLVVDYELMGPFLLERLNEIESALGVDVSENLHILSMEKSKWDPVALRQSLANTEYDFIALDPLYKLMGARSENDAADMIELLGEIDDIIHATGATVQVTHHFRKGGLSDVRSIDRMSGSGVLARDPDTILALTRSEDEEYGSDHLQVDATVRNFPPIDSFVVQFTFPLFRVTDIPTGAIMPNGRSGKIDIVKLASVLPEHGCSMKEWRDLIKDKLKMTWKSEIRETINLEAQKGRYITREPDPFGGDSFSYKPTKKVYQ